MLILADVGAQFRDRQRRNISSVKIQGHVVCCIVVRDAELPAVASAVLFGLDCELLLAYRFVFYLLLTLPIYIDINAITIFKKDELEVHVERVFVLEPKA